MPATMSSLNPAARPFVPTAPVAVPGARDVNVDLPEDPFDLSNATEVRWTDTEGSRVCRSA